jgi:hypothetical protein
MRNFPLTLLLLAVGISAVLVVTAVTAMVVIHRRQLRRRGITDDRTIPDRLRAVLPRQFRISSLFILTTVAALSFAVIRLPVPLPEKGVALLAQWMCLWCWLNRNYLHPLQGTISYAARRKMAVSSFVGSVLWLPVLIWFYISRGYRSSHPIWFSDIVFWGAIFLTVAIATWKLVRALQPGVRWENFIEIPASDSGPSGQGPSVVRGSPTHCF